jgi:hypothetical protein
MNACQLFVLLSLIADIIQLLLILLTTSGVEVLPKRCRRSKSLDLRTVLDRVSLDTFLRLGMPTACLPLPPHSLTCQSQLDEVEEQSNVLEPQDTEDP